MDFKQLDSTVDVAFRYGPFAFGIILVLIAAKLKRSSTPAKLIWGYFGSGIAFMVISVVWWLAQPSMQVYEGSIHDLTPSEQLDSDDLNFFYREELKKVAPQQDQLRNVRFALLRRGRASADEGFPIEYWKAGGRRERFVIPLKAGAARTFTVVFDEKLGKNRLQPLSTTGGSGAWLPALGFGRRAFAAPPPAPEPLVDAVPQMAAPPRPAAAPPSAAARPAPAKPPRTQAAAPPPAAVASRIDAPSSERIAVLQDPGSGVGSKIDALDDLLQYESVGVGILLTGSGQQGPVAATLLDLSRHSDPELAYKARTLLARRNLVADVASGLQSADLRTRESSRLVLASMDRAQTNAVLNKLPPAERQKLGSGGEEEQPVPTGSRQGDRYYVKAEWDPGSARTVDCLTRYFNELLVARRTLETERKVMRGRRERLVYGYSRGQAVSVAHAVRACGGVASYVIPWKS